MLGKSYNDQRNIQETRSNPEQAGKIGGPDHRKTIAIETLKSWAFTEQNMKLNPIRRLSKP